MLIEEQMSKGESTGHEESNLSQIDRLEQQVRELTSKLNEFKLQQSVLSVRYW